MRVFMTRSYMCEQLIHVSRTRKASYTYPVWQLLICHESFKTGLTFPITSPHFLPRSKGLKAVFVTEVKEQKKSYSNYFDK